MYIYTCFLMVRKSQGLIYRIYLNHQPRVMVAFILRQTRRQETKNQVIETRPGQNRRYFTGGPEISGPSLGHGIIIFSPETSDKFWGKVTTQLEFLMFCSSQNIIIYYPKVMTGMSGKEKRRSGRGSICFFQSW